MGRGDSRRSPKMRRRKSQKRRKLRIKRRHEAGKTASDESETK